MWYHAIYNILIVQAGLDFRDGSRRKHTVGFKGNCLAGSEQGHKDSTISTKLGEVLR